MRTQYFPVVIIGSGIAGLLTAISLSRKGVASVVVTKTLLADNSSRMAQGGIAAFLPQNTHDSLELHVQDTLQAGAGLSDEAVTRAILAEGHAAIDDLLSLGVPFDRNGSQLAMTREAAHSTSRILHAGGDATGRMIQDTLIETTQADRNIMVLEECVALSLIVEQGQCCGVEAVCYGPFESDARLRLLGGFTVLATGGIGQLYSQTTNPAIATGDGMALAYLAGAQLQDMEFVQFHPTAFYADGSVRFLISEALRGEGAILRDRAGRAFAQDYHPMGELAPRDIVSRAIFSQIAKDGQGCVWLDITHISTETVELRFPNILKACLHYGVDIRKDWIPVAPAAHYAMGGVKVNASGQTSVQGLYAVGETVSTGLHGANRLASNSLLECVVLARRVASHIAQKPVAPPSEAVLKQVSPQTRVKLETPSTLEPLTRAFREMMWQHVGIIRTEKGVKEALLAIQDWQQSAQARGLLTCAPKGVAYRNMLLTGQLICQAALSRLESRGAHYRQDMPHTNPEACHTLQTLSSPQEVFTLC